MSAICPKAHIQMVWAKCDPKPDIRSFSHRARFKRKADILMLSQKVSKQPKGDIRDVAQCA